MITFENSNGGIGLHARFDVLRDGKSVATIHRYGAQHPWEITSVHYAEPLGGSRELERAKELARNLTYPTHVEVYEAVAARVAEKRRAYIERENYTKMATLIRELVGGSNSARVELEKLVAEMDAFIADRADTHEKLEAQRDAEYARNGRTGPYPVGRSSDYPFYPELAGNRRPRP